MKVQARQFSPKQVFKRADCNLYTYPTQGLIVNSSDPLVVKWDTSCFTQVAAIDLTLYAPYIEANSTKLQTWTQVNYALGQYQVQLMPRWWNATSNVELRFSFQQSGNPFGSEFGPGPMFNATYTPPANGKINPDADTSVHDSKFQTVKNFIKGLSPGEKAVAALLPLLFIFGIVAAVFIRRSRAKVALKRKRFSTALDTRMSTISNNWQSLSAAGAQAAIRHSMATFGRPSESGPRPSMSAKSASRVSFATESYYGARASAADIIPPLPTRSNDKLHLSPLQTEGAFSLSAEEIQSRLAGHPYGRTSAYDRSSAYESDPLDKDVLPALAMMREGADGDLLLPTAQTPTSVAQQLPLPPVPAALPAPTSPLAPMPFSPTSELGPDALMRQYAAQRTASIASPAPTAQRTVYSGTIRSTSGDSNPFRASVAHTDADASIYSGLDAASDHEVGHAA